MRICAFGRRGPGVGPPWVLWVTRRHVVVVGWYGGAGKGKAKLAGGTACGGFVMVVLSACWSRGVMEVEWGGVGGLPPACVESLRGGRNPSQVAGYGPPAFRIITSYRESEPASGATDEGRGGGHSL